MALYLYSMAGGDDGPLHWSGKRMQMVTEQDRRYGICIMHQGRHANRCMINMKPKTCDRRFRLRKRDCQVCNQTAVAKIRQASATRQSVWPRWLFTADNVVNLIILFEFCAHISSRIGFLFAGNYYFRSCGCSLAHLHTNVMHTPVAKINVLGLNGNSFFFVIKCNFCIFEILSTNLLLDLS